MKTPHTLDPILLAVCERKHFLIPRPLEKLTYIVLFLVVQGLFFSLETLFIKRDQFELNKTLNPFIDVLAVEVSLPY